jgi:ribonuclease P protein component
MRAIHRLDRKDASSVLRYGRRISGTLFNLAVRPSGLPYARFVFVVGRATDKRAVVRNRLRRRAGEYIRTHPDVAPPRRDIAVMIKKEAAAATRHDFYDALAAILTRVS